MGRSQESVCIPQASVHMGGKTIFHSPFFNPGDYLLSAANDEVCWSHFNSKCSHFYFQCIMLSFGHFRISRLVR